MRGLAPTRPVFQIDSALQGQQGIELVCRALEERRPYATAFVDVRMPPGWDGIETVTRVLERTEQLETVHKELRDASHEAGMAEVATNVLHNVGNVLNSVNVSADLVAQQAQTQSASVSRLSASAV